MVMYQAGSVFFSGVQLDNTLTGLNSSGFDVRNSTQLSMFIRMDSSGAPTSVNLTAQGSRDNANWYDLAQAPFSGLSYTGAGASGIAHMFTGDCDMSYFRIQATGAGLTATKIVRLHRVEANFNRR